MVGRELRIGDRVHLVKPFRVMKGKTKRGRPRYRTVTTSSFGIVDDIRDGVAKPIKVVFHEVGEQGWFTPDEITVVGSGDLLWFQSPDVVGKAVTAVRPAIYHGGIRINVGERGQVEEVFPVGNQPRASVRVAFLKRGKVIRVQLPSDCLELAD